MRSLSTNRFIVCYFASIGQHSESKHLRLGHYEVSKYFNVDAFIMGLTVLTLQTAQPSTNAIILVYRESCASAKHMENACFITKGVKLRMSSKNVPLGTSKPASTLAF